MIRSPIYVRIEERPRPTARCVLKLGLGKYLMYFGVLGYLKIKLYFQQNTYLECKIYENCTKPIKCFKIVFQIKVNCIIYLFTSL